LGLSQKVLSIHFITREPFIAGGFRVFFCPDASGQKNYRENITIESAQKKEEQWWALAT
jgi:hypothetical protein